MTSKKAIHNLKIRFIPYDKFRSNKIGSFLEKMGNDTLILIDAKLTPDEEANLIKETMGKVSGDFSGIELNSLEATTGNELTPFDRIKNMVIEKIVGKKSGFTIIGPAKTVHQIRKNPEELLLHM
jgi:hypothetical protein